MFFICELKWTMTDWNNSFKQKFQKSIARHMVDLAQGYKPVQNTDDKSHE